MDPITIDSSENSPLPGKEDFPYINPDILFWENPKEIPASMNMTGTVKTGFDVEEKFKQFIEDRRVEVSGTEAINEVVGMEDLKQTIVDAIVAPQRINVHPDLLLQAILIAGPPGTAKTTLLSQAAIISAKSLGTPVSYFKILYDEAQSSYVGESEKFLKLVFETASKYQPSIVLIDEADGFMRKRTAKESDGTSRFKSALLTTMQGYSKNPGVLLLATTNRPNEIDEGYQRRFQERFLVKLPTTEERMQIFRHFLRMCEQTVNVNWKSIDFQLLANNSKRFSGDDVRNVIAKALRTKYAHMKKTNQDLQKEVLTMKDLRKSLAQSKATCKSKPYRELLKWGRKMTTNRTSRHDEKEITGKSKSCITVASRFLSQIGKACICVFMGCCC